MFYDTRKNDHGLPHNPFKAIVTPRPIGWITSMSAKGEVNLAPYSFFNGITDKPPIVMFSSEGPKDSVAFAEETKEFVCSLATFDLRDQMNGTSAPLPRGTSFSPPDLKLRRRGWSNRRASPPHPARWSASGCKPFGCTTSKDARSNAMWCLARPSASISTTASSRTDGSTPPRCGRSRAAAMTSTPWSSRCSR